MSERIVKIAIALSLFCLVASAAFYVSSSADETLAEAATQTQPNPRSKSGVKPRGRSFEGDFGAARAPQVQPSDGAPLTDAFEVAPHEEDAPTDGLIAGGIFLSGYESLTDDVTVYLVQVKAYELPPAPEELGGEGEPDDAVSEAIELEPVRTTGRPRIKAPGHSVVFNEDGTEQIVSEPMDAPAGETGELEEAAEEEEFALAEETPEPEEVYPEEQHQEPIYPDEEGNFEALVAPGEYQLVARARGHTPVLIEGITVQAGEEVRGLVIEFKKGLKLAGYVRAGQTESPLETLEGVEVTAEGQGYLQTRYTDAQGAFEFEGLPEGSFEIKAFDSLAGRAEAHARAGETTVSLQLRFNELTGTVVDEQGVPVADVEVVGRAKYKLAAEVDRDPYGATDGMSLPVAEDMDATEEQYAVTDESGRFTLRMASDERATLSVQASDDASAFLSEVDPRSRAVQLRVSRGAELKLLVSSVPEGQAEVFIDLEPVGEDSPFYTQSQSVSAGEAIFYVPAGVTWVLRPDSGVRVDVIGPLPSNVKLGPVKPLRRIKHPRVAAQAQIIY